jgi:large subunit ribosomal protein L30
MANLKITQIRSLIGRPENQRNIVKGLGLKRIRHTVIRPDVPEVRGAVFKVKHLVSVVPTDEAVTPGHHSRVAKSEG